MCIRDRVKGGSLAQLSGVSPLSTGYYLTQKAAWNQLRCPSPLSGKSKRKGGTHVKLTRHNGRAGKNGVYNPKHNDRSFDIANSEHIDEELSLIHICFLCAGKVPSVYPLPAALQRGTQTESQ